MPLSIKSTKEIIGRAANRLKCLPSEVQVRVKEHSRPRVICPAVHTVLELNELINATYPHLSSNSKAADEGSKQKKGVLL